MLCDLCYLILFGIPVLGLSLLLVPIPVGHASLVSDLSVAVSLDIVVVIVITTVDVHES